MKRVLAGFALSMTLVAFGCSSTRDTPSDAPEMADLGATIHTDTATGDPPAPTTQTNSDCLAQLPYGCAPNLCTSTSCKVYCSGLYQKCTRWVGCSQSYFNCESTCRTNRFCPAVCYSQYRTCMGY